MVVKRTRGRRYVEVLGQKANSFMAKGRAVEEIADELGVSENVIRMVLVDASSVGTKELRVRVQGEQNE